MTYFVHINQQSDEGLPPDQWVEVKVGNMTDATVEVLRNRLGHDQPAKAFVALNKHVNGVPFMCQGFALIWGEKPNRETAF